MCKSRLLVCLIVVAGTWANSEDGSDLNLKSIFRTPKDFSKVNFDHFELLERNNFDDKDEITKNVDSEADKPEDKPSKSVANAQVMLRIGGEDIHDCEKVILHRSSCPIGSVGYSEVHPLNSNDIRYPHLPHPGYPYVPPHSYIPGCYYGPNYVPSSPYHGKSAAPHEFSKYSSETLTSLEKPGEGHFLEVPEKEDVVVCTESPRAQVILEKPNPSATPVQEVEVVSSSNEHRSNAEHHVHLNSESSQSVVKDSCGNEHVEASTPECITINTIHATSVHPNPPPTNVAYAEVNLADIGRACLDTPKDNIGTLLDQALVPLSCQKCSQTNPLLASYPLVSHEDSADTTPEDEIVVPEYTKCRHSIFCEPCSIERNPQIPYGQRFCKDVDSLYDIADNSPELYVPASLYNEAPSESLIRVQNALPPKRYIFTSPVVPVEEECHHELSYEKVAASPCPEKHEVQIAEPCTETVESPCVKHEDVQDSSPCSEAVTNVESSHSESVTVQQVPSAEATTEIHHDDECSSQKTCEEPCHQEVTETCTKTIESPCATQEVVHVSNPCHDTCTSQSAYQEVQSVGHLAPDCHNVINEHYPHQEIGHTDLYSESPYIQETAQVGSPYHEYSYSSSPYAQQTVEVSNACHESPYSISPYVQEAVQIGSPYHESSYSTSPYVQTVEAGHPYHESSYSTSPYVQTVEAGHPCHESSYSTSPYVQTVEAGHPYHESSYSTSPYVQTVEASNPYHESSYSTSPYVQTVEAGHPCHESSYSTSPSVQSVEAGHPYHESSYSTSPYVQTVEAGHPYHESSYSTSPCIQTVEAGHPYHESSYSTSPYLQTAEVSNSCHESPYVTQEVVQTSSPHQESIQPILQNLPSANNYAVAYSKPEVAYYSHPESSSIPEGVQVTNLYSGSPYTTQKVVQTAPSSHTITIEPVYKQFQPVSTYRSFLTKLYPQTEVTQTHNPYTECSSTQEVVQVGNPYNEAPYTSHKFTQESSPCSKTATIQPAYKRVPTIRTRSFCPQTETVQSHNPYAESSCAQQMVHVGNPCNQAHYASQSVQASNSYPGIVQSFYNNIPSSAQYQAGYLKQPYTQKEIVQTFFVPEPSGESQGSGLYPHTATAAYPTTEINIEKPSVYYNGANTNSHSQYSVEYAKCGNEQSKVYVDGYKATGGSDYYSDSSKSVAYKHPTVVDSFKVTNPGLQCGGCSKPQKTVVQTCQSSNPALDYMKQQNNQLLSILNSYRASISPVDQHSAGYGQTQPQHPLLSLLDSCKAPHSITPVGQHGALTRCVPEHTKISQPHIYKIVGRPDTVPRGHVGAPNVPDLIPTNQYLKISRSVCPGQYQPVDNVPLVRNEAYTLGCGRGLPFLKNVPAQRQIPLSPHYVRVCNACAKYKGELNQVSCDR